jgi:AcrR family transcriptional regulator
MIRADGYPSTTIKGICAEVGIGVGTFYHYFRSKEELLLAFIDEENKGFLEFYAGCDRSSCRRAILSVADHHVDIYLSNGTSLVSRVYSMLLSSAIDFSNINEYAFARILKNAFRQGQRNGEFTSGVSADTFCNLAMGEWFYFTSLWCNHPESFNLREMIARGYRRLLKLVTAPDGTGK